MYKWLEIEHLQHIKHDIDKRMDYFLDNNLSKPEYPKIAYRGKIKLHGTNASVVIHPNGEVIAQGRKRELSFSDDQFGFCKFVNQNKTQFQKLKKEVPIVIHGEWAGSGIQKGVATSQILWKIFAVFALETISEDYIGSRYTIEPSIIKHILKFDDLEIPNMHILPWETDEMIFDFGDSVQLELITDQLSKLVSEIDQCDPWVKRNIGIEGVGEGLVMYPIAPLSEIVVKDFLSKYIFKAKGPSHQIAGKEKTVRTDIPKVEGIEEFVDMILPESRLIQGLQEIGGVADIRKTGEFLKWIGQDVLKESKRELESSGFSWKTVCKYMNPKAREWFMSKVQ